jgi:hypothetical protein
MELRAICWRCSKQKGELIEPLKPIVYYIDPATPEKWENISSKVLMIDSLENVVGKC